MAEAVNLKNEEFEWEPGTISTALKNKEITEEQGTNLFLDWRLRGNMYDMEPDEVKAAMDRGKMSDEQVERYLNRKEHPIWWMTKDLAAGAVKGVEKGVENIATTFNELPGITHGLDAWNWLMGTATLPELQIQKKVDLDTGIPEAEALPGKLIGGIAQFATGFIPAGKMVQALGIGVKIMNSGKLAMFAKELPKLRGFMQASIEGMTAGAAADYSVFDPFEGRAVDFLDDLGVLPEYLDFMTTNEDNPAALERLKNVLEGAVIGGAFDTILFGIKALKSAAYHKYFGDLDELARDLNNVPKLSKAYDQAKLAEIADAAQRPKLSEGVDKSAKEIVEPGASQGADFHEVDLETFNQSLEPSTRSTFLHKYSAEEVNGHQFYLSKDGEAGVGISNTGEIVNLFNNSRIKGIGKEALDFAISKGGRRLDCYDGYLTDYYSKHGFKETGREAWNDKYAPKNWDYKKDGTPDVVYMELKAEPKEPKVLKGKSPKMGKLKEQEIRSYRIFKKVKEGAEPEFADTFIKKMEHFEDVDQIVKHVYDEAESIMKAERKTKGHVATETASSKEIKKLAAVTGGDPDGIMNHMRNTYGEIKGATTKARTMYRTLVTYADQVNIMCKEYTGDVSETLRIIEHLKQLQELQAMVYGIRTESGRLLNMHNMKHTKARFDFTDFKAMKNLPDYVQKNKSKFEDVIKEYANKGSAEEKLKFSRFLGKGGLMHWLLSLSQASKLWSPVTHMVNTTSQTGAVVFRLAARSFGYAAMSAQKLDPIYLKTFVKECAGLGQALKVCFKGPRGLKDVKKTALKEGLTMKQALMQDPEIGTFYKAFFGREGVIDPSVKWDDAEISLSQGPLAKVGRNMDAIIKIPFNFLSGVDEVFKTIGTQMDYYARIYGDGIEKGYRGTDLDKFFKKAAKQGKPDFFNEALKVGKEVTFQDDLGKMTKHIEQALNANAVGLGIRMFFIPFYKTTVNLMKYAGKNSVLGLGSKTVREGLMAGGVKTYETIARITMGTAAMYWAWNAYEDGMITGRLPADQRETLRAAKVLEYAHYNEKTREWVSMRRGDPFALWLALAADFHMAMDVYAQYKAGDMDREFEDVFAAFLSAAVEPTINATWMKGMKDFMEFIGDPEKSKHKAKRVGLKLIEGMIPGTTMIDYINSEFGNDSYYREMHDLTDLLWKKLDSTKLLPRRCPIYGTPVPRENRWLHAVHKKTFTDDPVLLEMVRTGTNVKSPRDYLEEGGVKVRLTQKQVDQFEEIYSKFPVKDVLTRIVKSKGFQTIGDDATKSEVLRSVISEFRQAAKGLYLAENPEVTQELINKIVNRAQAIAGFIEAKDPSAALYHWSHLITR